MSFPQPLAAKIKSINIDPLALANNVELAYMLSFSNYHISTDSVQGSPKDSYISPLQSYSFVDFDQTTYETLSAQTRKTYELKNSTAIKSIRNSFKEFFTRVSAMTYSAALKKDELLSSAASATTLRIPSIQTQYKIDQMRGNNPNDWPRNLKEFHDEISKLPWNAFAYEPDIYFDDFFKNAFQALKNFIKKLSTANNRFEIVKDIYLVVQIVLLLSLKTNNQTNVLTQLQVLNSLELQLYLQQKEIHQLVCKLQSYCQEIFEKIPVNQQQQYHVPKKLWDKGMAFMIMKKIHFQKQNGLTYFSVTNDGTYLYIYISSINGGMFKIGTGKNNSIAGKIYLQRQVILPVGAKLDEINWVYCKGRLYLKTSARQPYSIEVINPENFKTQYTVELKIPSLFGHQSLINLNRNAILLTDGQRIYLLGKSLKITQSKSQKKQQQAKIIAQEDDTKQGKRKKAKKQQKVQQANQTQKSNPQQIDKVLQFVLYEFDLNKGQQNIQCDEQLAKELYSNFNTYFTIQECRRALDLCENDLSEAAQWLVDQGEKQRATKVLYSTKHVIIAQSEITSNFAEKNLKGSNQIVTKQGSILHTQNVHQSIWTMDEDQITCYTDVGFKIFSKSAADSHNINQNSSLKTTHLKTAQGKIPRNPEYTISYDPYNRIFYTFTWPTDGGHYFPTAVLIGTEHKQYAQLTNQKKISLSRSDPNNLLDFSKWAIRNMNLLDNTHCPDQGRINNWLWYFAQKILELNKEINGNQEVDKKKLINKRSKLLTKMNKVSQHFQIYQKNKLQFQNNGRIITQVKLVPPFGSDGSLQNLIKIRKLYGKQLNPDQIYQFLFSLEGWLSSCPKILNKHIRKQLYKIRDQLIAIKPKTNQTASKKLNELFITYFFEFFDKASDKQEFIICLDKNQVNKFIQKNHQPQSRNRRSIVFQTKIKQNILQKYQSKNKFEEIFPIVSNVPLKEIYQTRTMGNLMTEVQNKQQKAVLYRFLQKQIINGTNGIKLFEYLFLEAFRTILKQKQSEGYTKQLQSLFLQSFKIIQKVVGQANVNLLKNISDLINQILQIYFASLCSLNSSIQITQNLLKILDHLQRKQITNLYTLIDDMQFEGISQTFQKIHQTPHPIQRGKNHNFPSFKNPQASLIYAEFDKRCQSDPNHDNLTIQITHQNSPVGNSINCNDGVFTTNLRLTGKVDSGKPYLIMGNSVLIDFSSSSHAKDAKSFGRFGFKFGLRPIFAGKIKYKKDSGDKIEKIFGSKSQFQKYINTLKLLTVTISNSIENIIHVEKQDLQGGQIQKFLNGKIFKQGYQQQLDIINSLSNDNKYISVQNLFGEKSKTKFDGRFLLIKTLHGQNLKKYENKGASKIIQKQNKQDQKPLWDLDGIPGYIKSYVEKIKNLNGDFIDVFLQARKLALPQGIYSNQLRKSGFTQQMKQLWLQGQAILFLTVLKHSGLLHLNIKFSIEYIKANLKAFQEARNGIYESFIRRMQSVREWRDLLQTYHQKKQEKQSDQEKVQKSTQPTKNEKKLGGVQIKKKGMVTKTIKLQNNKNKTVQKVEKKTIKKEQNEDKQIQKRKKQIEKNIRQRLTQDYMIKPLCAIKNIQYTPSQTYENVSRIIALLEQEFKQKKVQQQSVYVQPIKHLIKSCLFLLKLKSSSTKQILHQEEDLEPEQMSRSYSQDPRHVNVNKVNVFREWLQNWKKWKDFKKQGKVELKFPVSEIIYFVNSWIPIQKFKSQIKSRVKIAQNRIKFYELTNNLLKYTSNSLLSKYALGTEVANIKGSYNAGLQSVSANKIKQLMDKYNEYSTSLKLQQQRKFRQLPLKLKQIQHLIKSQPQNILQKIKLTSIHLYLIESQNPKIDLDIPLFLIPLKFLNNSNQQLIYIATLIIQRAYISDHCLQEIISKLWKQVGNDSLSCRRWRDLYFIQRLLFLLRKLQAKTRQKLQVPQKQKVAEILFYLIYHLQVPIICRVCLRILNLLKITLTRDISTPFQKTYKAIVFSQKGQKIQQIKLQNIDQYNNIELVAKKCYNIFKIQSKNQIRQKLLAPFKQINSQLQNKQNLYNIILNLNQQEDIAWIVVVLYYLQQIQKTIVPIKDWEQYLGRKNKKKQHHKDKDKDKQQTGQDSQSLNVDKLNKKSFDQRILQNIPRNISNLIDQIQANLPIGWYFNYCNVYNQTNVSKAQIQSPTALNVQNVPPNLTQKKGKNANQQQNQAEKKKWNPVQYYKLTKKFEDLTSKPLEEPKQQEPEQNKIEFIKAKNFISRMRKHCNEASVIFTNLSQNGYFIFRQDVPKQKCQIICQLFTLGGLYKLKQIPCQFKTKDYATKLSPSICYPTKKSQLKITCVRADQFRRYNDIINAPIGTNIKVQNNPLLFYTALATNEFTFQDKSHLPYDEFLEVDSNQEDIKIQFSKYFMESSFSRMQKTHDSVYLKEYPKLRYNLLQGGLQSGLKQCILIPTFDCNLSCEKSNLNQILPSPPKYQVIQDSQQLIEKIIKLLKYPFSQIKQKQHIIPYLLLCCYLEKLSNMDIQFVSVDLLKQFEDSLSRFVRSFKANNSIEGYRQKIHVFITKMLDSQNSNLSQFRLYRYDDERIQELLNTFVDSQKLKASLKQQIGSSKKQTIQSHQYPKSNYLLPVHIPIPEQNKLLKYWQKNILPKIYDFVKNSLRPLEIEDFFQQMRIQLRKGDQLQAKKKAYVICDNKLPAGAVLPDANHNWNSLTIDDVAVGQDVLLRFPKSKHESTSPLLFSHNQQRRVVQIMFIDQKNFSVLIRQRLPQLGLFAYNWVPINSLQAPEESLAHYSSQKIYKLLQQSLKGIIYNYSKNCITSLSKKFKISMQSLFEQTIVDMIRDNPISGWNSGKKWPLKQALKAQLAEGNTRIVQVFQQKFYPIQSYDIDLFSQNLINLNRYENSLGLIVSFKKTSSLIWYSGIRFYADQYGYKQIANVQASKTCINQLSPLQFKNPNVYCKYYATKQFLKSFQLQKYQQKQINATVISVDPIWSFSTYLSNVIGQIAEDQTKYEDILTRFNVVFLKWLQKRQAIYLSTELCRVIIKNTLRIRKICSKTKRPITLQLLGTSEEQLKSFLQWINLLKQAQQKDVLVLYSPLLQNLIQLFCSLTNGFQKPNQLTLTIPNFINQVIRLIQMTSEIENNLNGKKNKKYSTNNDTQWERILVIENIPPFINQKELRQKIKAILVKNNGKLLAPSFDIFYSDEQAVVLVDSWDITELVQQEVMEKIQQQQERQPEQEQEAQGLLMEWACEVCTYINQVGSPNCVMCDAAAPAPKTEIVYEQVQSKDVNQTEMKLRQKQMKRFENVKEQIKIYINEAWNKQCLRIDQQKITQQKAKQQRRKKKGKAIQIEQKILQKPIQPKISLSSGSLVLGKKIIEEFLKYRYNKLPTSITEKVNNQQNISYLNKFKELARQGYDLWGDNIANQTPSILKFEYLSDLMQYIQDQICKGSSSVLSYDQASIRMINHIPLLQHQNEQPLNFTAQNNIAVKTKYKRLAEQKSYNIRYSWKVIRQLNLSASKCLFFINMNLVSSQQGKIISSTNTIGANLKCLRQLIMGALKLQIFQKVMQRTSAIVQAEDIPKISLQRLKVQNESNKSFKVITLKEKDEFLFTKAHEQLQKVSSISLRPFKPKGTEPYLSFSVKLKGQIVQGEAGPYRQFFTDISNELNPQSGLKLFIKTPNNLHKIGQGRSKWTINPKANSTYCLSLFHFLGRLMGCCIRTGCHMTLDLASFCWKLIIDEKVKEADMDELDHTFFEQNKQLIDCPSEDTFQLIEQAYGQPITWVYTTVDGQQQQLIANGKSQRVPYQERAKYVDMMEKRRIQQISLQVIKIKQGLNQMIPEAFLNNISGEQLKTMICGVPKVDVQLLRKHTKYTGGLNQQTPIIKYFWQMMKQIPESERLKLVRFCWGQQRLPLNSQQFERNGVRFMIKPMLNKQNPDQALPKADTCFFNIQLPQYSTKEILKQRILLAINLDNVSINGDREQPDDNPLMGNVDYEDDGEGENYEEGGGRGEEE